MGVFACNGAPPLHNSWARPCFSLLTVLRREVEEVMSTPLLNSVRLQLCDALSSEPAVITKFANHLQEKSLITESTRQDVMGTQGIKPYDQATKLADAVIVRLNGRQNATSNWHKLLETLTCCGLNDLAENLDLEKSKGIITV